MKRIIAMIALMTSASAWAADDPQIKVVVNLVNAQGAAAPAGEVSIRQTPYGLLLQPALSGLPAGVHGFHIHQNASCEAFAREGKMEPAMAAGGHWDPNSTGKHEGPYGQGHLGDLPAIYVGADGRAE